MAANKTTKKVTEKASSATVKPKASKAVKKAETNYQKIKQNRG